MGLYLGSYSNNPSVGPPPPIPKILGIDFTDILNTSFTDDAIIDTGADVSSIPKSLIQKYNLFHTSSTKVTLPDGTTQPYNTYFLEVKVLGLTSVTDDFVDSGFSDIILGRPILNKWIITLDPQKAQGSYEIQIQD